MKGKTASSSRWLRRQGRVRSHAHKQLPALFATTKDLGSNRERYSYSATIDNTSPDLYKFISAYSFGCGTGSLLVGSYMSRLPFIIQDPLVKQAAVDQYRSRSAFKLMELDDKFHFLRRGSIVVSASMVEQQSTKVRRPLP